MRKVTLESLTDAEVGETLRFFYKGQNDVEAKLRLAQVEEVGPYWVRAKDLDKREDHPKQFINSRASHITVHTEPVAPPKKVASVVLEKGRAAFANNRDELLLVTSGQDGLHILTNKTSLQNPSVEELAEALQEHFAKN